MSSDNDLARREGSAPVEGGESETRDGIVRNTSFALAVQLSGAVFTAGLTIFLVRMLGPAEYGTFALALGIGGVLLIPSDLGISQSTARFVAESRGDQRAVERFIAQALALKLVVAVLLSGALFAGAGLVAAAYDAPSLEWPVRATAIALLGQSFMVFYGASFGALGKMALHLRVVLSESAVETATAVALVLLGAGATGAVLGRASGYLFSAGVGLALLVRHVGRGTLRPGSWAEGHVRQILGYAGALVIVDGAFTLFSRIDVLLIGAILGVRAVGLFEAPLRLVAFLGYVGLAASKGVAPRLVRGLRDEPDVTAFERAIRLLVIVQASLVAPVLVWGGPLTEFTLGPGYEESADVLRALTPFVFLSGISPLLALSLNYLGEARRRIPIAIGAVLVNLAIDLVLLSRIGIVAGAIATDVAYSIYTAAHLWICKRLLGVSLRPLAGVLLRSSLAAAAMAGVLLLFGTSNVSPSVILPGGVLGLAAFVLVILATGEVTRPELAAARRALERRVSARRSKT